MHSLNVSLTRPRLTRARLTRARLTRARMPSLAATRTRRLATLHRRRLATPRTLSIAAAPLLLCWFAAAAAAQPYAVPPERQDRGFFMIGANFLDLDELNTRLRAADYPELSDRLFSIGGGGYTLRGKLMLGGEGHLLLGDEETRQGDEFDISLSGGYGFLNLGYTVRRTTRLALYPFAGIGGGGMLLNIAPTSAPSFDAVLNDPRRGANLSTFDFMLNAGFGAEFTVGEFEAGEKLTGFVLGVRAGYTFVPGDTDWQLERNATAGSPADNVDGAWFRILFGGY